MGRTEEDKVVQAGIEVILGDEKYTIRPLVIRDSREWRKGVVELLSSLPEYVNVTTDTPDEFRSALNAIMVALPDKVVDLFFQYAKELDWQKIEAIATDAELAKALEQVVEIAFPLAQSMTKTMERLAKAR